MKVFISIILACLVCGTVAIPWRDQIALVNSLEVGRDEEPMIWGCTGCDSNNKPLSSSIIQEPVKDVKAILSVYAEYSVLAFRYTATVKNIEQDLLWAVQHQDEHADSGCKVQGQMDDMWNSIRDQTIQQLKNLPHTNRLLITGISLGGALTVLSYVDIYQAKIFQNIELVTFGAPRVGNKKWAEWFDKQTALRGTESIRFTLSTDPIPVLPRCLTLLCNYGHTGKKIQCIKSTNTCHCIDEDNSLNLRSDNILPAIQEAIAQHASESEHQPEGYGIGILDHMYEYKNVKDYTVQC